MNVRTNVLLKFNSNLGGVVRLNIPRADKALTAERAQATMTDIISDGIVITGDGIPVSIRGAEIVKTSREPLVNA